MSFFDGLRHRVHVLLHGARYESDVERELRFHMELEAASQRKDGLEPHDAAAAARRRLGNVSSVREEVRSLTLPGMLDRVRQDLAYAWRGLVRAPGFTATVVATLALGLGLNAAVFSLLDRLFVRAPAAIGRP